MLKYTLFKLFIFLSLLISAQSANFLKTFTPTPAFASTPGHFIPNMDPYGLSLMNPSFFILGGAYSGLSNTTQDTILDDSYLIKNQTNGLTKWFRRYHLSKRRLFFDDIGVKYNSDIIGVGRAYNIQDSEYPDGIILTTDSNGWLKSAHIYPNQKISKVTVLKDKKIAIISSDSNSYNKLVLLDKNCNLIWSKRIYHADITHINFTFYELIEGKDKSLLLVGRKYIDFINAGYAWYPYVLLCDSNGNKINDFTLPIGASQFINAITNFDNGFYIIGSGTSPTDTEHLYGHMLKVDNLLQINWYQLYQSNYPYVEFSDLSIQNRNNILILTEPESTWVRRSGFTFMDSLGNIRKSYLFSPLDKTLFPNKMLSIDSGKLIFTLQNNFGRLFGITDTLQSSFCNLDTLTWNIFDPSVMPTYNHVSLINSPFTYINDTAYVYTPKDAELQYLCSDGPNEPLDTINYPPSPPNLTSIKKNYNNEDMDGLFSIQPNPATTSLIITTKGSLKSSTNLSIMNSEGKLMIQQEVFDYLFPLKINLSHFPNGLYMLSIKTLNGGLYNSKFIVNSE